jgi:hypothetical protein
MFFFQLPCIPEWYAMHGHGKYTQVGLIEISAQHVPRAVRPHELPGTPLNHRREAGKTVTVRTVYIRSDADMYLRSKGVQICGDTQPFFEEAPRERVQ